jgi:hypothetical protein
VVTMNKIVLTLVIILVASGVYVFGSLLTGTPPFCSADGNGYFPCSYSETFPISINYSGSWKAQYYGYNGAPYGVFSSNGSFVGGNFNGTGDFIKSITLSGPDNKGLGICALAKKLDQSQNNLTISVGNPAYSDSTNSPLGSTYICTGVYP